MYCKKCGKIVEDGLTTCPECGFGLVNETAANGAEPEAQARFVSYMEQNQPTAPQQAYVNFNQGGQPKKKKTGLIAGVSVAAVLIVAVVAGFFAYPSILRSISPAGYIEYSQKQTMKVFEKQDAALNKALGESVVEKVNSGVASHKLSIDFSEFSTGEDEVDAVLQAIKADIFATIDNPGKKAYGGLNLDAAGDTVNMSVFADEDKLVMEVPEEFGLSKVKVEESGIAEKWNNSFMAEIFGELDADVDFADMFKNESSLRETEDKILKDFNEKYYDLIKNHSQVKNGGKQNIEELGGSYYDMVITADPEAWGEALKETLSEIYSEENLAKMFAFVPMGATGISDMADEMQDVIDEINLRDFVVHMYMNDKNYCVGYLIDFEGDETGKASIGVYFRDSKNLINDVLIDISVTDKDGEENRFRIESKGNHTMADGIFANDTTIEILGAGQESEITFSLCWDSNKKTDNLSLSIGIGADDSTASVKLLGNYVVDNEAGLISFSSTGIDAEMVDEYYEIEESYSLRWNIAYEYTSGKAEDVKEISADDAMDLFDDEFTATVEAALEGLMGGGMNDYEFEENYDYSEDFDYEDFDFDSLEGLEDLEDLDPEALEELQAQLEAEMDAAM